MSSSSLKGITPADSYKDLLHISTGNVGIDPDVLSVIYDGNGNFTPISVSQKQVQIDFNSGLAIDVVTKSERTRFFAFPAPVGTSTLTLSVLGGNVQQFILSTNVTSFVITDPPNVGDYFELTLFIVQDNSGNKTLSWPTGTKWSGGISPTLTTAANKTDIIKIATFDGGITWYGRTVGLNY